VPAILQRHCSACHAWTAGETKALAPAIAKAVETRAMPPWKVSAPVGIWKNERRLTPAEIASISAWAKNPRAARDIVSTRTPPPEPDLVVTMPEPFSIPAHSHDLYQCFAIPVKLPANRWVRAIDFRPGNASVVHHALVFAGKPEKRSYPCFGAPGFIPARGLGGWSPGNGLGEFPPGTAALLPANTDVVIQIHYHSHTGRDEADRSSVALYFAEGPPEKQLLDIALGSTAIDIPAGAPAHRVRDYFTVPVDVWLLGVIPHMHHVGKKVRGWADGRLLFEIRDWDFNWQDRYWYKKPILLKAGTRLEAEFVYDNSIANPRNPSNPPKRVTWGFGIEDEMAGLHFQVVPVRAADAEELGQTLWGKMIRMMGR